MSKNGIPLHVTKIVSNVKGGVDAQLSERVLIVGPNGSGKDALVNSMTLALTGRAYDVAGRESFAKGIELLTLAPEGAALKSRVTLSDGSEARFSVERNAKTGGAKKAAVEAPKHAVRFPVQEIQEHLTGSPEKARSYLLTHIVTSVSLSDVLDRLPANLHDQYAAQASRARDAIGGTVDEIAVLKWVTAQAKSQGAEARREAKAGANLVTDLGAAMGAPATDSQVQKAKDVALLAQESYEDALKARPDKLRNRLAQERERAVALTQEVKKGRASVQAAQSELNVLPSSAPEVRKLRDALVSIFEFNLRPDTQAEIATGQPMSEALRGQFRDRLEGLRKHRSHDAQIDALQRKIKEGNGVVGNLTPVAREAIRTFQAIEKDLAEAEALNGTAQTGLDELKAGAGTAQVHYETLLKRSQRWASVQGAKDSISEAEDRQAQAEKLHAKCAEVIEELVEGARVNFIASVQAYLPEVDTFDLRLREGGRSVCRFGFLRDGALHTALSGAEWARLTLAMASAVVNANDELVILTPEERAYDPLTLRAVMEALRDGKPQGQVLITSPHKPARGKVAGWTIVETTG